MPWGQRVAAVARVLVTLSMLAPGVVIAASAPSSVASTSDINRGTAAGPTAGAGSTGADPRAEPARSTPAPALPSFMRVEVKLLVGSLVLAGLLWGATRLLRRWPLTGFLASTPGPIRVVARAHLGAKESLCLINVGATSILLAVTAHTIRTLHVWPEGVGASPSGQEPLASGVRLPGAGPAVPGQLRNLHSWLPGARR